MVIVYASKTGFTRRYAAMLSESTKMEMYGVEELHRVPKGEEVLYLGWMKVGKVQGLQKMKSHQVVAVCGSGTGRTAEPSEEEVRKRNGLEETPFFYLRGGCKPLRELKGFDKVMLSMFVKALKKSAEKDERQKEAVEIIVDGFDGVREENLEHVYRWLQEKA